MFSFSCSQELVLFWQSYHYNTCICLPFPSLNFLPLSVFLYSFPIILKIHLPFDEEVPFAWCALTMSVYNVFVRNFVQMQIRSKQRNIVETLEISLHGNHITNDKLMPVWLILGSSLLKMAIVTYKRHETSWPKIGFRRWLFWLGNQMPNYWYRLRTPKKTIIALLWFSS